MRQPTTPFFIQLTGIHRRCTTSRVHLLFSVKQMRKCMTCEHKTVQLTQQYLEYLVTSCTDGKSRRQVNTPPPLPGIQRATSLKILGVTVTNKLSISDHVSNVIRACAQSLHAIRCHGMCNSALQTIYRAVIVSKLFCASSAWWGFTTAANRQRLECVPSPWSLCWTVWCRRFQRHTDC